jgi:5-(carboxyamino)imidazole ribonucleotide synthase
MVFQPGSTIGILGGGQLGRMTALAARQMGYRVVILDPTPGCPAAQVADDHIIGRFDDLDAASRLAASCNVVTMEFENFAVATADHLASLLPVRPAAHILRLAQNRLLEKSFLREAGIPVTPFAAVHHDNSLAAALLQVGLPAVLKTATMGYDGKGQVRVHSEQEARAGYAALRGTCILERLVDFERELSIIVARDVDGNVVTYEPAENNHSGGILDTSMAPARVDQVLAEEARDIGSRIATALELVGILAVELFVKADGTMLANEIAPRPHNSGHWSIEGCQTSQFEQQVRATVGARVGPVGLLSPVATANLLGDLWCDGEPLWGKLLEMPDVKLHLYGKREARPGRKMGHLTSLASSPLVARERVLAARAALVGREWI